MDNNFVNKALNENRRAITLLVNSDFMDKIEASDPILRYFLYAMI